MSNVTPVVRVALLGPDPPNGDDLVTLAFRQMTWVERRFDFC